MRTTVVTGSFTADHMRPYGEFRHGHDWHVRVKFPSGHFGDHKQGVEDVLDSLLGTLDHKFLDDIVPDPSNEGIAEWIGHQLGALDVYVWRYDRGREFGGGWSA